MRRRMRLGMKEIVVQLPGGIKERWLKPRSCHKCGEDTVAETGLCRTCRARNEPWRRLGRVQL
jgi:hypothetical protein